MLENLSSLATLTLNVREREKYAPTAPVVASFGTQISRTWESSMTRLIDFGKAIVLWVVNWAIWGPLYLVGAIVALKGRPAALEQLVGGGQISLIQARQLASAAEPASSAEISLELPIRSESARRGRA